MIEGVRVLDLTDERGNLAGQILAGLGADVIAVEPPGGQPARALGPFAGDEPGPNRSLVHWSMNRGKRSVVLDLAGSEADRARFGDLVRRADVVLETAVPGELDALGLAVGDLAAINPALVHVSMTGFGSTGPKAGWAAPDLVALAASGQLRLCGDADRSPLRCSVPQAWAHVAGDAACAALVALWERRHSGLGQHCDVSAQVSVMQATQSLILNHPYGVPMAARVGGGMRLGPLDIRLVWPCKDGTVTITFLFGASAGPFSARLFQWIWEEGGCDEATRDLDWIGFGNELSSGAVPIAEFDRVKDPWPPSA
jgi:crotonobetainyl-CoA:carnitine CoA-transferase CaiB-like acyl-CoA transferase